MKIGDITEKALYLYEGGHIDIRHIIPSPLVYVGCYTNPSGLNVKHHCIAEKQKKNIGDITKIKTSNVK